MKRIVAPLALLASISLLTSCTKKEEVPVVPAVKTETPAPVMQDNTPAPTPTPTVTETPAPTMADSGMAPTPAMPEATASGATGTTESVAPTASTPITRTETVSYKTPAGSDTIEFSVTVDNGIITAANATVKAENDISKKFQEGFVSKVGTLVGKSAKDLDVKAVGGASLATTAFKMFVQSF